MATHVIRATVRVEQDVSDRDTWAVDLVERSDLSDPLKEGWFWATWPDRVEFTFTVQAERSSIAQYTSEIEKFLLRAPHVMGKPQLTVEERGGNEA